MVFLVETLMSTHLYVYSIHKKIINVRYCNTKKQFKKTDIIVIQTNRPSNSMMIESMKFGNKNRPVINECTIRMEVINDINRVDNEIITTTCPINTNMSVWVSSISTIYLLGNGAH